MGEASKELGQGQHGLGVCGGSPPRVMRWPPAWDSWWQGQPMSGCLAPDVYLSSRPGCSRS
jgi:hypothetical protein